MRPLGLQRAGSLTDGASNVPNCSRPTLLRDFSEWNNASTGSAGMALGLTDQLIGPEECCDGNANSGSRQKNKRKEFQQGAQYLK